MKTVFVFSILFCLIASPALGDLTNADLDKIRLIIQEEIKKEISESEKRMMDYVNLKIEGVEKQIISVEKQIISVEKQITFLMNVVYGLIVLIIAAIGIPQLILTSRNRRDQSLERRVEMLTEEIEILKRQKIV